MDRGDVLVEFASEHYSHARDHEQLRAQITSILCAASFVLIGFALGKDTGSEAMIGAGLFAAALGLLNLKINRLHENRFEAHVAAASHALYGLEQALPKKDAIPTLCECREQFDKIKSGHLSETWALIPKVVMVAGAFLAIAGVLGLAE